MDILILIQYDKICTKITLFKMISSLKTVALNILKVIVPLSSDKIYSYFQLNL